MAPRRILLLCVWIAALAALTGCAPLAALTDKLPQSGETKYQDVAITGTKKLATIQEGSSENQSTMEVTTRQGTKVRFIAEGAAFKVIRPDGRQAFLTCEAEGVEGKLPFEVHEVATSEPGLSVWIILAGTTRQRKINDGFWLIGEQGGKFVCYISPEDTRKQGIWIGKDASHYAAWKMQDNGLLLSCYHIKDYDDRGRPSQEKTPVFDNSRRFAYDGTRLLRHLAGLHGLVVHGGPKLQQEATGPARTVAGKPLIHPMKKPPGEIILSLGAF